MDHAADEFLHSNSDPSTANLSTSHITQEIASTTPSLPKENHMNTIEVSSTNFEQHVLQADVPVLVDFYSTQCPPCRALAPHLEKLAEEFGDCVRIVKVNVDHDPQLAMRYVVTAVPTLIWFDAGREVDRSIGANPAALRQKLNILCIA